MSERSRKQHNSYKTLKVVEMKEEKILVRETSLSIDDDLSEHRKEDVEYTIRNSHSLLIHNITSVNVFIA